MRAAENAEERDVDTESHGSAAGGGGGLSRGQACGGGEETGVLDGRVPQMRWVRACPGQGCSAQCAALSTACAWRWGAGDCCARSPDHNHPAAVIHTRNTPACLP